MQRVCFLMRVRPDLADEYVRRHAEVWPEMRAELARTGWHNYSLFAAGDGLIVAYLETEDFDAAREAMSLTEVNARWQAEMAPFFVGIEGNADENMAPLREVFHLD
jgi:L-rhamnose mutarotase